jgi:hypothetical protein
MRSLKWIVALGIASLGAGTAAHADNTGIYAGGSIGQAKTDFSNDALDDLLDGKDTAFKLFLGYRVLDWVGFEAEYVDLGEITSRDQPGIPIGGQRLRLEEAGFGAFGMLYWTPVPQVDLFAKAGFVVSQAHLRANGFFNTIDTTDNSTDLSWGVGAQVRFDKLAVRAEYQRFEIDVADGFDPPDMISIGASWTFF